MTRSEASLRAHLGAHGCQTKMLHGEALLETAALAFDIRVSDIVSMAAAAERLGRKIRRDRVLRAIKTHWPTPNALWPAKAPIRRYIPNAQVR